MNEYEKLKLNMIEIESTEKVFGDHINMLLKT